MGGLSWAGKFNDHIASFYLLDIIGFNSQQHLQTIRIRLINERVDSKRRNKLTRDSIVHHSELPLGWFYLQSSVYIKFAGVHCLVKVAVIEYDESHIGVALSNCKVFW